jgi:hypothetical protein
MGAIKQEAPIMLPCFPLTLLNGSPPSHPGRGVTGLRRSSSVATLWSGPGCGAGRQRASALTASMQPIASRSPTGPGRSTRFDRSVSSRRGVFDEAAQRLEASGHVSTARVECLRSASAHWLRHSAGSRMADGDVDLRHVRDTFGHASLSTTSVYLHTEDDERHRATEAGHRLGWE